MMTFYKPRCKDELVNDVSVSTKSKNDNEEYQIRPLESGLIYTS